MSVNITGQTITNTAVMGQIIEFHRCLGPQVTANITFEITRNDRTGIARDRQRHSPSTRDLGSRVAQMTSGPATAR